MRIVKRIFIPFQTALRWFRKTRKRNKILVLIGLFVLAFILIGRILNAQANPPYTTERVKRGDVTQVVSQTGSVNTSGRIDVYSTATGIVEKLSVANNDSVTPNQILFSVKSTATDQEKAAAQASYLAAKSTLDAAQASEHSLRSVMYTKWDTFVNLATNGTYENGDNSPNETNRLKAEFQSAQDNWQKAEADYKNQSTVVSQAQSALQSASLALQTTQNAVVKAPTGGTVTNLSVFIGDKVTVGTTTPVLTLANLQEVSLKLAVTEIDITKLQEKQTAMIKLDAFPDKEFHGTVARVDSVGNTTAGVIRYNVYITVNDPDQGIKPGMTANADINVDHVSNVLTVPNSAVRPYKGGKAVRYFSTKTRSIEYLPVKIGIKGKEKTQIVEGLKEGQEIIVSLSNDQLKRPGLF